MAEHSMPATEAAPTEEALDTEATSYELAFHILPTVADEEVATVEEALKDHIAQAGGRVTSEEAAARYDLVYEIKKAIDGKNQRFRSAHFGWVRFTLERDALAALKEAYDARSDLLRYMIIALTKEEEAHPFRVHETVALMPEIVGEERDETIEKKSETEDATEEVKEEELDESLEKITQ